MIIMTEIILKSKNYILGCNCRKLILNAIQTIYIINPLPLDILDDSPFLQLLASKARPARVFKRQNSTGLMWVQQGLYRQSWWRNRTIMVNMVEWGLHRQSLCRYRKVGENNFFFNFIKQERALVFYSLIFIPRCQYCTCKLR